jgi:flagellar biosynthetic protein FliR
MFFPGFNERYVFTRANLVLAFFLSLILSNLIPNLPQAPESPFALILCILLEVMLGIIIGLSAQIIFLSIHIAGALMSVQSGMSAANVFDPTQGTQVPIITNIFTMFCLAAIFTTDTHHIMFAAIANSYEKLPAGNIHLADMTEFITATISKSFLLGLKISAPFMIVNIAITVANGLLARLMPSFQVFFVMTPAQILVLFALLLVTLNPILEAVIINIQENIGIFAL